MKLGIAFQPDLLGVMSQFSQFDDILKKHLATATEKSAGRIGDNMVSFMWTHFNDPTGPLEDSVSMQIQNEYMAYIGPTLIYGPRRNWGFSGMTDAAGRFFAYDPGILYAESTLNDTSVLLDVAGNYIEAVQAAWQECIGALPQGSSAVAGLL